MIKKKSIEMFKTLKHINLLKVFHIPIHPKQKNGRIIIRYYLRIALHRRCCNPIFYCPLLNNAFRKCDANFSASTFCIGLPVITLLSCPDVLIETVG